MYSQLNQFSILKDYLSNKNFYIIHLIRKNSLEKYISRIRMKKNKIAHTENKITINKMEVNIKHMLKNIIKEEIRISKMRKMFSKKEKYLEVFYEDFVVDLEEVLLQIEKFLCIKHFTVETPNIKKIAPKE